jgi:hypothetical protein
MNQSKKAARWVWASKGNTKIEFHCFNRWPKAALKGIHQAVVPITKKVVTSLQMRHLRGVGFSPDALAACPSM